MDKGKFSGNQFTMGWTNTRIIGHRPRMSLAFIALATLLQSDDAFASGVQRVDVRDDRIIVQFDGVVDKASSFEIEGPQRIALDVGGAERSQNASQGGGVVSAVRQAQFSPGTARIVFDLTRPAVVSGGGFSADGRTLTLALRPVGPGDFSQSARGGRKIFVPPASHRSAPPRTKYNIVVPLDPPSAGLPRPRILGPAGRPLVVIDAGHGGHDPGSISPVSGVREKDITLGIALRIRDELLASGRVRVALVREDDRFYVLRERTAIARNIGADLFISVHADSAGASEASGATIYTLSEVASDREAAALAARENKSDIINGVNLSGENADIANILVDLAQRETMNASAGFAQLLRRESAGLIPFRTGYHRMAGFAVLKAPDTPAILLETGYLTNADDVRRLASPEGQKRIAQGVRKAVEIHFAKRMAQR
jgi:N-acetylmuramoyl-L-alanine amidase